jgi:diguanylate cyclase (GGDEF)-like protein
VNDIHGREVGDQVLKNVAAILRSNVKSGDPVVRCGCDEFAIVLEDVPKDTAERVAARVADRVVEGPQEALGKRVDIVVSVGVATFPEDGSDLARLLASASSALAEKRRTAS